MGVQGIGKSMMSIFGLGGGGSSGGKSFIWAVKNKALGKSKRPDRIIRRTDFVDMIRKNLNQISALSGVEKKNKDGTVSKVKIGVNQLSDIIKNSELVGKTEIKAKKMLEKNKGFSVMEKGEKVFFDLSGSKEMSDVRKYIGQALEVERERPALTPEQIKLNVRMSKTIGRMAGGMGDSWQEKIKSKRENPLAVRKKSGGTAHAKYRVGALQAVKEFSEGDFREAGGANYFSGNKATFAARAGQEDKTADLTRDDSATTHKEDVIKLFQNFQQ